MGAKPSGEWQEDIIQLILRLQQDRKRTINAAMYDKLAKRDAHPPLKEIIDGFGSWTQLLVRAGIITLENLDPHAIWRLDHLRMPREKWTIRESLIICRHLHGSYISSSDYNRIRKEHPEMPSRATIVKRYGGWADALRSHGLTPRSRFTDEECLAFLRVALEEQQHLNSVEYDRWAVDRGAPRLLALTKRFGSWAAALRMARGIEEQGRRSEDGHD